MSIANILKTTIQHLPPTTNSTLPVARAPAALPPIWYAAAAAATLAPQNYSASSPTRDATQSPSAPMSSEPTQVSQPQVNGNAQAVTINQPVVVPSARIPSVQCPAPAMLHQTQTPQFPPGVKVPAHVGTFTNCQAFDITTGTSTRDVNYYEAWMSITTKPGYRLLRDIDCYGAGMSITTELLKITGRFHELLKVQFQSTEALRDRVTIQLSRMRFLTVMLTYANSFFENGKESVMGGRKRTMGMG
ncbi:hypothetical protein K435DRAFT_940142 [Dendrothele bispora CBS 962.96]|uniref:Uncharacterized protein n=1 Tax=Dendrothele bispora (strain CBS 962.96) TaxID=1314807 RepID=A0A4S8KWQ2_DENBC|nr:hypothetical protein K435DRAFT_940142 [Dendrothele bispora CBS 962.96]